MKSDFSKFDHVFDVVVVGAGSAGCVVAARLTEKGNTDVCLIEAGDRDRDPWFHIPMGFGKTTVNPKYLWGYRTEPDPGIANRSLVWTRGKVLGGSGSINFFGGLPPTTTSGRGKARGVGPTAKCCPISEGWRPRP